jgi:hypothetical protein
LLEPVGVQLAGLQTHRVAAFERFDPLLSERFAECRDVSLFHAAERNRELAVDDLERPENPKLHHRLRVDLRRPYQWSPHRNSRGSTPTRAVSYRGATTSGELAFMHVVIVAVFVVGAALIAESDHTFHWSDAGIGAAAGFGIALAVVGVLSLVRVPRPPTEEATFQPLGQGGLRCVGQSMEED